MVQLTDFSAPSAWYLTAKKKPPPSTTQQASKPSLAPPRGQLCSEEGDSPPRAARKKRVAFATDFPDCLSDSSDHPSDLPGLSSSDVSSVASEEDDLPPMPLWTVASFHMGPFFLNIIFASHHG
eukprot:EG_transcript_11164